MNHFPHGFQFDGMETVTEPSRSAAKHGCRARDEGKDAVIVTGRSAAEPVTKSSREGDGSVTVDTDSFSQPPAWRNLIQTALLVFAHLFAKTHGPRFNIKAVHRDTQQETEMVAINLIVVDALTDGRRAGALWGSQASPSIRVFPSAGTTVPKMGKGKAQRTPLSLRTETFLILTQNKLSPF